MPDLNQKKHCILLVEDDVFIKDLYERTLNKRGYQVLTAENGQEGLEKAYEYENEIELVLLDIMLPKKNGIELLKDLAEKKLTDKFTVVLLTNLGQESIIREAFQIGAKGYMLKARVLPNQVADQVDEFFTTGKYPFHDRNGV